MIRLSRILFVSLQFVPVQAAEKGGPAPCATEQDFIAQTALLNSACCDDPSTCATGLPITCSKACSLVLTPIRDACRDFLDQPANFAIKKALDETAETCHSKGCASTIDIDGVAETKCQHTKIGRKCTAQCRDGFIILNQVRPPTGGGHRRVQDDGEPLSFTCATTKRWAADNGGECVAVVSQGPDGVAPQGTPSEIDSDSAASTSKFTGADPGEGLDFIGDFVFAVNIRGPGGFRIGDAAFISDDDASTGVTVTAENEILSWGSPVELGASHDDNNLELLLSSIRWSGLPNTVDVALAGLEPSVEYKLQLLFWEQCCERGFDVLVGGRSIVDEFSPKDIQDEASGAMIVYDFVAGNAGKLTINLDGSHSEFPDRNPILNGLTLERDPSSNKPAEVDLSTAASTGTFTGADPGEGLDFAGNFLYAVNVGGPGGVQIGDAAFTDDASVSGVTVTAQNVIEAWGDPLDWGDSAGDDALEQLMQSIRWSGAPDGVSVTLDGLRAGTEYRLQLMFHEQCCSRGFDVAVNGQQIVDEYSPQRDQGGLSGGGRPGASINYDFTASSSTLTIELSGTDASFADTNPILNAFTLEVDPNK